MRFAVRKHRLVDEDQLEAALWYDERQPGLADAFLDESEHVISLLATNALLYSIRFDDVRCIRLRRFRPYGVFYVISGSEVRLLAIHHGARDERWLRLRRKQLG